MRARPAHLAVLLVLLSTACGKKVDPVQKTLDGVVAAAEKGSPSDLVALLADDFKAANGEGRPETELNVKRYLMAYDGLKVTLSDVKIDRGGSGAFVTFKADVSGTPKNIGGLSAYLPSSASFRFELRMAERNGEMRIVWASWQQL